MKEKKPISFKQLIKKSEKKNKPILGEFVAAVEVKNYIPLIEKVVAKSIIGEEYLTLQTNINSLQEVNTTDENIAKMLGDMNDLSKKQEIDYCFRILNLYCEGVYFDIDEDLMDKEKEYDLIFSSGIYNFILSFCGEDKKEFEKMLDHYIASGMNTASLIMLKQLIQTLIGSIDIKALEGMKEELIALSQTEGFKELTEISQKIK